MHDLYYILITLVFVAFVIFIAFQVLRRPKLSTNPDKWSGTEKAVMREYWCD